MLPRSSYSMWAFGCDVLTLVILLKELSPANGGATAELKFVNGKYSGGVDIKRDRRNLLATLAMSHKTATSAFACTKETECPWYAAIEKVGTTTRFADVGQLLTCEGNDQIGFTCNPCTAFYVGPDLLATAGHCVVRVGITEPTKQLLVFLHQFDGKTRMATADDLAPIADRARFVTEWWIPEGYYNNVEGECGSAKTGYDVAFLRVNQPKTSPDSYYTLAQPDRLIVREPPTPVLIVGYPNDQAGYRRPVKVEAKLHAPGDPKLADILNIPKADNALARYQSAKLLVMVASKKGGMYGGGSGGPVFEAAEESATLRNVIGIAAFTKKQLTLKGGKECKRDYKTLKTEATLTLTITEELVKAMKLLREGKPVQAATAKPIPTGKKEACF